MIVLVVTTFLISSLFSVESANLTTAEESFSNRIDLLFKVSFPTEFLKDAAACCANDPCINGGSCQDGKCICPSGFTGNRCEVEIINCVGSWGEFSDCNVTCGTGKRTRQYSISTNSSGGGKDCCYEDLTTETIDCKQPICQNGRPCTEGTCDCGSNHGGTFCDVEIIDCVGSWLTTSACDVTCGTGSQNQIYDITVTPSGGGSTCPATDGETRSNPCSMPDCQNSRSCVNGACDCGPDFTGTHCETPVGPSCNTCVGPGFFGNNAENQPTAENDCQNGVTPGSHLYSFNSDEDVAQNKMAVFNCGQDLSDPSLPPQDVWIGYRKTGSIWIWEDGTVYDLWGTNGVPTGCAGGNCCTFIDATTKEFAVGPCNTAKSYACECP